MTIGQNSFPSNVDNCRIQHPSKSKTDPNRSIQAAGITVYNFILIKYIGTASIPLDRVHKLTFSRPTLYASAIKVEAGVSVMDRPATMQPVRI